MLLRSSFKKFIVIAVVGVAFGGVSVEAATAMRGTSEISQINPMAAAINQSMSQNDGLSDAGEQSYGSQDQSTN